MNNAFCTSDAEIGGVTWAFGVGGAWGGTGRLGDLLQLDRMQASRTIINGFLSRDGEMENRSSYFFIVALSNQGI